MTSFDSKVMLGSQKMRTHVTMVFAWSEPTDIFLYCEITMLKFIYNFTFLFIYLFK